MPRSFSNVKLLAALVADNISPAIIRRSRHAAATGSQGLRISGKATKEEMTRKAGVEESWVPDPVTGYYRPGNTEVADVAELRTKIHENNKH